jgi:hypothetical protein
MTLQDRKSYISFQRKIDGTSNKTLKRFGYVIRRKSVRANNKSLKLYSFIL